MNRSQPVNIMILKFSVGGGKPAQITQHIEISTESCLWFMWICTSCFINPVHIFFTKSLSLTHRSHSQSPHHKPFIPIRTRSTLLLLSHEELGYCTPLNRKLPLSSPSPLKSLSSVVLVTTTNQEISGGLLIW